MVSRLYRAELLYNSVDNLIQDNEVFPICVPSYSRPDAPFLRYVNELPVILFIRKEQKSMYKAYQGKCKIVELEEVEEIGQTRKAIVDWATNEGYKDIFMVDDDISHLSFLLPSKSTKSDKDFMRMYSTINNIPEAIDLKVFKMWVWLIRRCSDKLTISGAGAKSDWWNIQYKNSQAVYNSGSTIQCIHLNLENLKKYDINYIDTRVGGTEDYSLQYQVMAAGLYTTIFKDLVFRVPSVGSGKGGNVSDVELVQKYQKFIQLFQDNVLLNKDTSKVGIKTSKGGIPSIKFNWARWREPVGMMYNIDDIYNELEMRGVNNE